MRELLLALGMDRPAIDDWITRRRSSDTKDIRQRHYHKPAIRDSTCNKASGVDSSSAPSSQQRCSLSCEMNRQTGSSLLSDPVTNQSSATVRDNLVPDKSSPPRETSSSSGSIREISRHEEGLLAKGPNISEKSSQPPSAPCKLLTRFASNPRSDVSQIIGGSDSESKPDGAEGALPCEKAYKLLMRYATCEEKLESLARTLEDGCVPDSGGGCKVKNETVSQALLDTCL